MTKPLAKPLLLIALLGCASMLGQTANGVVSGQLRDQSGNPVPSVRVVLTRSTNRMSVETNANGVFRFERLPPGEYKLTALAHQTTIFPGTTDAAPMIVVSAAVPFVQAKLADTPPDGTQFPGTVEIALGTVLENVNFALDTAPANDASLKAIHGKIVVEDGGRPALSMGQLGFFFSDGPDNQGANLTFLDKPAVVTSTRFEPRTFQNTLDSVNNVMPLPRIPDGAFRVYVRDGVYRVIQPGPPAGVQPIHSGSPVYYYVKGLSFGSTDLMKELMTVRGPIKDELLITLARCTSENKDEPLCH